jgi:fatty-acyl-CoA synthase
VTVLTDQIRSQAGSTAVGLLFENERYTWGEIHDLGVQRAALLESLDLAEPKHLGVLLENVPETLFWLEAALLVGVTIVGLNSTRRGAELAADITHTDCGALLTDNAGAALLADTGTRLPTWVIGTPDYDAMLSPFAGAPVPDGRVPDSTRGVLIFTSGTTSAPKAAIRTQGALGRLGLGIAASWEVTAADVAYNAMPWFHSNALYHATFPTIATGGTIALRRRFSASGFVDDVRKFGATRFNYVGKVLEYILATPPRDIDADNRLRIVTGSEASERDIAAFSKRFDVYVMDGFGSTEGGVGILRTPDSPPGALGLPPDENTVVMNPATHDECPRARFDADGRLLNADEAIGELVNKAGLATFEGYYRNDEANAERARDGWYWSGDLGYRDEAGFFYFAGRGYDWLRVDGENFSAAPVERIVLRHPDVMLAAVYAVPDPNTGDQLMLAVQLDETASFDPVAFRRFLAEQSDLGTKWVPRFVRVSPALPTSHTNKLKKIQLRQEAWLVEDPIWYRPHRDDNFRPFTPADAASLERDFAAAGRLAMLPLGTATTPSTSHG